MKRFQVSGFRDATAQLKNSMLPMAIFGITGDALRLKAFSLYP
jgi:hypothetical protein